MIALLLFRANLFFAEKRHRCLFKECCSSYIAAEAGRGLGCGIKAFLYRYHGCRPGYLLFRNPLQGKPELILVTGEILHKDQIADEILYGVSAEFADNEVKTW